MKKRKKFKEIYPLIILKIIAVLLVLLAVQGLILFFGYIFVHSFKGEPVPEKLSWFRNLLPIGISIIIVALTAIGLFLRKNIARISAIVCLSVVSLKNLYAEFFPSILPTSPDSVFRLVLWSLHLAAAIYLLYSKKIRKLFKK